MDVNAYVQQVARHFTSSDRSDLMYYLDNAIANLRAGVDETPVSGNVLGQFGSTNSNDVDLFFLLKDEKEPRFTKVIEDFFTQISEGEDNMKKMDITFITTKEGQVNWSNKGNEAEINNAIYYTFEKHTFNYDVAEKAYRECPVLCTAHNDVGVKAIKTIRGLLTIISRTSHGREAKLAYTNKSITHRIDTIRNMLDDQGVFMAIDDEGLQKNQPDADLLKDVAFSFIQLKCLLESEPVPYTKNAVFNMSEFTNLLPFVFGMADFSNVYSHKLSDLDVLISDCVDQLKERITMDDDGVVMFEGDHDAYDIKKEKATVCQPVH